MRTTKLPRRAAYSSATVFARASVPASAEARSDNGRLFYIVLRGQTKLVRAVFNKVLQAAVPASRLGHVDAVLVTADKASILSNYLFVACDDPVAAAAELRSAVSGLTAVTFTSRDSRKRFVRSVDWLTPAQWEEFSEAVVRLEGWRKPGSLTVGATVEVVAGGFSGFPGTVVQVKSADTVVVEFTVLGRSFREEMEPDMLRSR